MASNAGKSYQRELVHRSDESEIHKVSWNEGAESPLHEHDGSKSLYLVHSGSLEEERYLPENGRFRYEKIILRAGEQSSLPPGGFHRVRALEPTVTLHSYWPAPATTTSPVSLETRRVLADARRQHLRALRAQAARSTDHLQERRKTLFAVVEELAPVWAEREAVANRMRQKRLPQETLREIRESGLLAGPLPHHLGGWGANLHETAEIVRFVARCAPATALALAMPLGNAATVCIPSDAVPVVDRAALAAGSRWICDRVLEGKILAVANSEPGSGGELKNTKTTAALGIDGVFRLTGRKSFATLGPDADYFLCAARRNSLSSNEQRDVVDGFFVARDADGLSLDDCWNPIGMGCTASVGLKLENAAAEAILGYPGCLEGVNARHWSTVLFAAVFLGIGEGAFNEGLKQISDRGIWSQAMLADCRLALDAAAGFLASVANEERWPLPAEARQRTQRLKTFVARTAVNTATQIATLSGGRCYTPHHPVFRFLCDALAGPLLRPPLPQAMDAIAQRLEPISTSSPFAV